MRGEKRVVEQYEQNDPICGFKNCIYIVWECVGKRERQREREREERKERMKISKRGSSEI